MPKYFIFLLSLFLLFLVAFTSVGAFLVYDNSRPSNTLSVTDSVKKIIKPDQATVQLVISQTGTDLVKMNKENDLIMSKVSEYLISKGIAKEKIKTNKTSFDNFEYLPDGTVKTPKQITAENTIEVEFVNLNNNPNAILTETINLGVTRYGQFSYKSKDMKTVCDALEAEAEKSVKTKAENKVNNIGGKIVKIQYNQTFTTGCDGNNSIPYFSTKANDLGSSASQSPELMTGEQELVSTASLNVEYR